ncbi:hypothetical protein DDB_G0290657 [Dictyostelium discoideum AX4]|uniref:hypothetical protein n=1 Tax=Dictyostelium discoideum AX4 TaxID=352472 RepID=UPI00004E4567|nr:hypothetical protein DDB_G0290657 [Dictyostelium discoideum AX4]EAL62189.1 hypothetical protein DDB_G0290657 [Dictyostelium discoideum AX4]|eukprot:XP_635640.1 hypothetical protein DDB_G0290657 [Dictyostelium discoideum AX4]
MAQDMLIPIMSPTDAEIKFYFFIFFFIFQSISQPFYFIFFLFYININIYKLFQPCVRLFGKKKIFAGDIRCQVSNKSIMLISLKITNSPNSNSRGSSSSSSTSKSSSKTSFTQ